MISNRFTQLALLLVCFTLSDVVEATESTSWRQEMEEHGINVWTRDLEKDSFKQVRAETVTNAGLRKLITFLQDETNNSRWVPYSGGATLLQRPSRDTSIIHFRVESSWPFKDRDCVAKFTISQDEDLNVRINMSSLPNYIPHHEGYVRMEKYTGYWLLTPTSKEQTKVVYVNHVDPGGRIPAWLANPFAIQTTFQALRNLNQQISDYQKTAPRLNFIKEP